MPPIFFEIFILLFSDHDPSDMFPFILGFLHFPRTSPPCALLNVVFNESQARAAVDEIKLGYQEVGEG